jgi:hypothetical protein
LLISSLYKFAEKFNFCLTDRSAPLLVFNPESLTWSKTQDPSLTDVVIELHLACSSTYFVK